MSASPAIADYTKYNHRMDLSMVDKMFFVDKIRPDLVVDFGCASGTLLRNLKSLNPDAAVLGYDNDPKMAQHSTDDVLIYSNWKAVENLVLSFKRPALILSSVIHEVFHYSGRTEIDEFWNMVFNTGFEYIVIRDMVPSRAVDRASCPNDVKKIYYKFLGTKLLNDFEAQWGNIESNRNLIHFLLKYKYAEPNWEREVRENYIPLNRETLLSKIPMNYDVVFHEHYVLPYIHNMVKSEIGIDMKDPTHIKLILKRITL